MKIFLMLFIICAMYPSAKTAAGDMPEKSGFSIAAAPIHLVKKDFKIIPLTMKEKFLALSNDNESDETSQPKVQSESFKVGPEVYYFLGAAALAAVIYFLIPDDEPASTTTYTFGLPITPQ